MHDLYYSINDESEESEESEDDIVPSKPDFRKTVKLNEATASEKGLGSLDSVESGKPASKPAQKRLTMKDQSSALKKKQTRVSKLLNVYDNNDGDQDLLHDLQPKQKSPNDSLKPTSPAHSDRDSDASSKSRPRLKSPGQEESKENDRDSPKPKKKKDGNSKNGNKNSASAMAGLNKKGKNDLM